VTGAYPWSQLPDIPAGAKALKEGAGAVTVRSFDGDTTFIYLLKGSGTTEFYRYNLALGSWETMLGAPTGASGKAFKNGSCLAYDEDQRVIFALKGSQNEFFAYAVDGNTWQTLTSLPLTGTGGKKKVKDGAGLAYHNGIVYAQKGGNTLEFWNYKLDSASWTELSAIPAGEKKVKGGGALLYAPRPGALYSSKGNNTLEFYRYGISDFTSGPATRPKNAMAVQLEHPVFGLSVAPNPLAGLARVNYSLAQAGSYRIRLYDVTGALKQVLSQGYAAAGNYVTALNAERLARGIYILKFETERDCTTQKLIIE
ncbi:MAG: T9SS type A sorting domain-containing protein, partial [candidate division WOR-3 bacterium]